FFDSMAVMSNLVFEMSPGQVLDSAEFASQFPITTDQSVLPTVTGDPQSGAEFNDPSVDSLPPNIKLALLPPEELPTLVFHETIPVLPPLLTLVQEEAVVPPNPALNITKDASVPGGTVDVAGEVISYTITVANTGNEALTGVTVTDPYADAGSVVRGPDVVGNNDANLEVGETWQYTAAHTVTQAELASNGGGDGFLENTATADSDQTGPDTADAAAPIDQSLFLTIVKDLTNADDAVVDTAGETIEYTITVANTGNANLTNVVLDDVFAGGATLISGDDGDNVLEAGETWVYSADYVVTQADLDAGGTLTNVAGITTDETARQTDDATSTVAQSKILHLEKDATVADGTADSTSDVINYTLAVTNTGNAAIAGVVVGDPFTTNETPVLAGAFNVGDTDQDNLLDVGETWQYT